MKYDLDLDVSLDDICLIFAAYGWMYAKDNCFGVPGPEDIKKNIYRLLQDIPRTSDFLRSGRISLVRSPEHPDSFEVYLDIGYLSPEAGDEIWEEEVV